MAQYQSHISFSVFIAAAYAFLGGFLFDLPLEQLLLSSVIVVVAGMLPDVDATGGVPEREVGGLLAAVAPIIVLEFFPGLHSGGVARIALVVISAYLLTRYIVVRALQKYTVHRGMIHSIPAGIITGQLVFLLFWDLHWFNRLFLASAAVVGYLSHLFLDGYTNLDLVGKAMGKEKKQSPALKFFAPSWGANLVMYGCVGVLSWVIAKDFYPNLRLIAALQF